MLALGFPLLLHIGASISLTSFTVHWSTVVGLVALAALYEWRARTTPDAAPRRGQRVAFHAALAVIFFALNGWLHDLSDYYLFSAHMVQHLLLTMLVPPLLIAGTPGWMLRPLLENRAVAAVARAITRPKVCFATFNIVIAAWHTPPLYNLAMAHHGIHIVPHPMFMASAVMLWWPI